MSRTKRAKPTLKVHEKPDEPSAVTELVVTESLVAKAAQEVAKATQEVADEKLAAAKKPKPRRVGPLSKLERMLVDQANDAQAPLVAEHQRLAKRMGELRVAMAKRDREVGQAILEGRGEGLAQDGEAVQLVEEGSDLFVQVVKIERAKA